MAFYTFPKSKQVNGEFNCGEIKEKKPIGFPQDGEGLRPYSNIFYWAHAKAEIDSTIAEHPHKGFEILTFVLQGEIEHYDSKNKIWKKLNAGDAQIIRSGNGITHAEALMKNAEIFQIWFDPDLHKSLNTDPSYDDYPSEKFPITIDKNLSIINYKADNAPVKMTSEGVEIKELSISESEHILNLKPDKTYSCFIIEGKIIIQEKTLNRGDFFVIMRQNHENIKILNDSRIFIIETPYKVSYKTYAELHNLHNKW